MLNAPDNAAPFGLLLDRARPLGGDALPSPPLLPGMLLDAELFGDVEHKLPGVSGLHDPIIGTICPPVSSVSEALRTGDKLSPDFSTIYRDIVSMPKGKTHDPGVVALICARTAELRKLSGKSQQDMAVALRMGLERYKKWENRSVMPTPMIVPFCIAAKGNPYYLLTGVGRKQLTDAEVATIDAMSKAPVTAKIEPIRPPERQPTAAAVRAVAGSGRVRQKRT